MTEREVKQEPKTYTKDDLLQFDNINRYSSFGNSKLAYNLSISAAIEQTHCSQTQNTAGIEVRGGVPEQGDGEGTVRGEAEPGADLQHAEHGQIPIQPGSASEDREAAEEHDGRAALRLLRPQGSRLRPPSRERQPENAQHDR